MRVIRFAFVGSVLALAVASCDYWFLDDDKPCTLIGCSSGFSLNLRPLNDRFQPGRYDVRVVPENDTTRSCFFVISNDTQSCASGHCVREETCNALYFVGYSDPDRVMISYPVLEAKLTIQVEREGLDVGELIVQPEYHSIQPNGPGCPPTCRRASASLQLN